MGLKAKPPNLIQIYPIISESAIISSQMCTLNMTQNSTTTVFSEEVYLRILKNML